MNFIFPVILTLELGYNLTSCRITYNLTSKAMLIALTLKLHYRRIGDGFLPAFAFLIVRLFNAITVHHLA